MEELMISRIVKRGDSYYLLLPTEIVKKFDIDSRCYVKVEVDGNSIIFRKIKDVIV